MIRARAPKAASSAEVAALGLDGSSGPDDASSEAWNALEAGSGADVWGAGELGDEEDNDSFIPEEGPPAEDSALGGNTSGPAPDASSGGQRPRGKRRKHKR